MSSISTLATIILIKDSDKGYTKLVLSNPIPWKTRYITLNVWRKHKLLYLDHTPYKAGDNVCVVYKPGKFNRLISLEPAKVDVCMIYYSLYYLPGDGQRIDCGGCSTFDSDRRKRSPTELKLIAITEKKGSFSIGFWLTFVDEVSDKLYFACTFVGRPYFNDLRVLKTQELYNVNGWIAKETDDGNYMIDLTDVPDISVQ